MKRKTLYREVDRLVTDALGRYGVERRHRGIFRRRITSDAVGGVGLNEAKKYNYQINPIISVQYLPLECLVAELEQRDWNPTKSGASIACPIGYLSPPYEYREWSFEEGRDNEATVTDMVNEITTVGFRYMEENCTLEKVCERLAVDRHFIMGNDVYQLSVGYMMLGRFDEAEEIVRKELDRIQWFAKPDDPYRRFAERIFHRLEEERARASRSSS